jgi:hypothetical protein
MQLAERTSSPSIKTEATAQRRPVVRVEAPQGLATA